MEEWVNSQLRAPDFGDALGGDSSSDGVNNQALYVCTLKTSSNSLTFVAYLLSKSASEDRRSATRGQASSGQSARSDARRRRRSGCGSLERIKVNKRCPCYRRQLDDANAGGGNPASGDSGDDGERESVEAREDVAITTRRCGART